MNKIVFFVFMKSVALACQAPELSASKVAVQKDTRNHVSQIVKVSDLW